MKAIKLLLAVLMLAASFELAGTESAQARPTEVTQRIVVRTGPVIRRRNVYVRRRAYVRRPYVRRWHRGYRRPWRRY
ncbi:hypothetical protein [Mucilaginibacter ginkgonis]|uniref:Uncharacterized protein n=1 Tax=Mucilaginibacter ginkgonis TaxID=2682091 RepID=A0A6I4HVP7_9SPHI|nr:hypothetical protein [Mucilaginibacter ginkgonis]QQL50354.1 hypothetical protein GO620_002545 [Mucilaginibacter ginkgonis]